MNQREFNLNGPVNRRRENPFSRSHRCENPFSHHRPLGVVPNRALSLLETTIAVTILGIGLIMVAAMFPVAIAQHRKSTLDARAVEMLGKARAALQARVAGQMLWVHPDFEPGGARAGQDTPWYLLAPLNISVGATCWDAMIQGSGPTLNFYGNLINGDDPTDAFDGNPLLLHPLDYLSDRLAPIRAAPPNCPSPAFGPIPSGASPFTDAELMAAGDRLVWYGFYQRLAGGEYRFGAAVCRQGRNQRFAEQNLLVADGSLMFANPFSIPTATAANNRRLPVPWRVSAAFDAASGVFSNVGPAPLLGGNGVGLGVLAPIGSKLMIQGEYYTNGASPVFVPAGRVLTVSDIIDNFSVEVVGDLSDIPHFDRGVGISVTLDLWVFPPAVVGNNLDDDSPVIEWKVPL